MTNTSTNRELFLSAIPFTIFDNIQYKFSDTNSNNEDCITNIKDECIGTVSKITNDSIVILWGAARLRCEYKFTDLKFNAVIDAKEAIKQASK